MTDKEIIKFIFKNSQTEFTKAEDKFKLKLDNERRKFKPISYFTTDSPMDWMAQGIYMGIKFAEKEMKRKGE